MLSAQARCRVGSVPGIPVRSLVTRQVFNWDRPILPIQGVCEKRESDKDPPSSSLTLATRASCSRTDSWHNPPPFSSPIPLPNTDTDAEPHTPRAWTLVLAVLLWRWFFLAALRTLIQNHHRVVIRHPTPIAIGIISIFAIVLRHLATSSPIPSFHPTVSARGMSDQARPDGTSSLFACQSLKHDAF